MASGSNRANGFRFSPRRFRAWRLANDLQQAELAKRIHYSRTLVTKIERGASPPTKRFYELLAQGFPGVDIHRDFFDYE